MSWILLLADDVARREWRFTGDHLIVMAVAAVLSVLCVLFHYEVMSLSSWYLPRIRVRRRSRIVGLILLMLVAHVAEVWAFGLTYWLLDRWPDLGQLPGAFDEGALDFVYYSVVTYTTLGFGDIVPEGPVRILTGAEGLLGLSLITWSASLAFLEMQRDWREYRKPSS